MPQLDFSTYTPQLIWLAISFGLLYLIMARVALPRIATAIEERRDKIADNLDQAVQLRRQADEVVQQYEIALDEARRRTHIIARETREQLHSETETHRLRIETELAKKIATAEVHITASHTKALQHVRSITSEATSNIVKQIMGHSPDSQRLISAVEGALERNSEDMSRGTV